MSISMGGNARARIWNQYLLDTFLRCLDLMVLPLVLGLCIHIYSVQNFLHSTLSAHLEKSKWVLTRGQPLYVSYCFQDFRYCTRRRIGRC